MRLLKLGTIGILTLAGCESPSPTVPTTDSGGTIGSGGITAQHYDEAPAPDTTTRTPAGSGLFGSGH